MANPQPRHAAKRWCFTINNYTPAELTSIVDTADSFDYLCFGRERGDNNTPHLQGFLILKVKLRLQNVKQLPGFERAHLEPARGTNQQAADYCKKDGDFDEYGELPENSQGKRTDFESLKEWLKGLEERPSDREVAEEYPSLWGRYKQSCISFMDLFCPSPVLADGELRQWQQRLFDLCSNEPDDRRIIFVVDERGNSGKSWMTRYLLSKYPDITQMLSVGKRDDLAHAIDPRKKLFLFDVPRGGMQYFQYGILEQLKNRLVFSPKYESTTKVLRDVPHVVVFCNERPDVEKMSADRPKILNLR